MHNHLRACTKMAKPNSENNWAVFFAKPLLSMISSERATKELTLSPLVKGDIANSNSTISLSFYIEGRLVDANQSVIPFVVHYIKISQHIPWNL